MAVYDRIGVGYAAVRQPDPRIEARIASPLAGARRILNVGAGSGSYEPPARVVAALEPSSQMIAQRAPGAAPAVRGVAEAPRCEARGTEARLGPRIGDRRDARRSPDGGSLVGLVGLAPDPLPTRCRDRAPERGP